MAAGAGGSCCSGGGGGSDCGGGVTGDTGDRLVKASAADLDPADEDKDAVMAAFFANSRRRLAEVQRSYAAGDAAGLRAEAHALSAAAASLGARCVADAAAALVRGRAGSSPAAPSGVDGVWSLRRGAVDGLELQLDAAEAIWRSCRLVI